MQPLHVIKLPTSNNQRTLIFNTMWSTNFRSIFIKIYFKQFQYQNKLEGPIFWQIKPFPHEM